MVCVGDSVAFGRCSRIWSGAHGDPSSSLLGGHGWHHNREYIVLEINRTGHFTQVKIKDPLLGDGWVNVWRAYSSGSVAVWAKVVRRALEHEEVADAMITVTADTAPHVG